MSVRIRLARIGKKRAPFYRIVAIDKRVKRDGKFLENLGTFNPLSGEIIQFHADRFQAWIDQGAIPSDSVVKLQRRFKKGQTAALENVEPVKKQTPSKAELEAEKAAQAVEAKGAEVEASAVEKTEEKLAESQTEDKA